uniref:hypothetical protein n=1 Tax=Thaumasiovibrio occultus TaxID=1891184 RepID=UPI00131B17D6|nr:hypothetical protein [Thaumasiovibrio occultus]
MKNADQTDKRLTTRRFLFKSKRAIAVTRCDIHRVSSATSIGNHLSVLSTSAPTNYPNLNAKPTELTLKPRLPIGFIALNTLT